MLNTPSIPVNPIGKTGIEVSELGFGAAALGNLYRPTSTTEALEAVNTAWHLGIHYYDTAPYYGFGLSERRLGDALREHVDDYVISTKVGRLIKPCAKAENKYGFCSPMPFEPVYDYSYDGVMRSFEDSYQRLGLSRIDILYMHDIGSLTHGDTNKTLFSQAMDGGYKAMDELRTQGVVKAIGLGVNEYEVCEAAMSHGDFDCFLLAGRYTLLEQTALLTFLPSCESKNISVIIGGPYNSGILATGTQSPHTPTYDYAPAHTDIIARVKNLENICRAHAIPLAAAALQFPLAHPSVVSVIPGLSSAARSQTTIDLYSTQIPIAFWADLKTEGLLDCNAPTPSKQ